MFDVPCSRLPRGIFPNCTQRKSSITLDRRHAYVSEPFELQTPMQITRRHFFRCSLGCALSAMTLDETISSAAGKTTPIPIGFQLYTVRGEFSRDVPKTLKTLGELGYAGVEFWGYTGTPDVYQKY